LSDSTHLLPPFLQPVFKITYECNGQYHKGFLSQFPNGAFCFSYKSHINKKTEDWGAPLPNLTSTWQDLCIEGILVPGHQLSSFQQPRAPHDNPGSAGLISAINLKRECPPSLLTSLHCGISPLLDSHIANIQRFLLKVCQTRFLRNSICSGNSRKIPFSWDSDLTPNSPGILSCVWCTTEWHYKHKSEILLVRMDDAKSCHEQFLPIFCSLLARQCRNKHAKCNLIYLVENNHLSSYLFHQKNSPSICTVISDPTLSEQHYHVANSISSSYKR
jgi:hypothetical protein